MSGRDRAGDNPDIPYRIKKGWRLMVEISFKRSPLSRHAITSYQHREEHEDYAVNSIKKL